MALATTTLSSALTASGDSCVVASATGIVAGDYMLIDQEFVRVAKSYSSGTTIPLSGRGVNGTVAAAHVSSANVTHGTGSDFANAGPQVAVAYPVAGKARTLTSYSASGAISLPTPGTDAVAVLNGTSTLTMTLAVPTKDMDGSVLTIVGNGKSASTVAIATVGFNDGGSNYIKMTFQNGGLCSLPLMAVNGSWVVLNTPITGTSTALSIAVGTA
jgi:hypothetical protein